MITRTVSLPFCCSIITSLPVPVISWDIHQSSSMLSINTGPICEQFRRVSPAQKISYQRASEGDGRESHHPNIMRYVGLSIVLVKRRCAFSVLTTSDSTISHIPLALNGKHFGNSLTVLQCSFFPPPSTWQGVTVMMNLLTRLGRKYPFALLRVFTSSK